MSARELSVALGFAVAMLTVDAGARQTPVPPASPPAVPAAPVAPVQKRLVGTWRLDHEQTPGGQDAWRRRVDALELSQLGGPTRLPTPGQPPDPNSGMPLVSGSGLDMAMVRTAMRDLLEIAERLSFQVATDSVTITDDLNRALKFSTRGNKEKRMLAATEFNVKTQWTDRVLSQEVSAWSFRMTQMYLPSDDGDELLVLYRVQKPEFSPKLKDIMRTYLRVK